MLIFFLLISLLLPLEIFAKKITLLDEPVKNQSLIEVIQKEITNKYESCIAGYYETSKRTINFKDAQYTGKKMIFDDQLEEIIEAKLEISLFNIKSTCDLIDPDNIFDAICNASAFLTIDRRWIFTKLRCFFYPIDLKEQE